MVLLMEACLQIITLLLIFHNIETLLRRLLQVVCCVNINDMHVANYVHPLIPEVPDEKVSLMLGFLCDICSFCVW